MEFKTSGGTQGEANNWTWLESINNKAYGTLSPALPFAYSVARTLEVTVNTNNSSSESPGLLYSRHGAESEMSDTDRNHINLHEKNRVKDEQPRTQ